MRQSSSVASRTLGPRRPRQAGARERDIGTGDLPLIMAGHGSPRVSQLEVESGLIAAGLCMIHHRDAFPNAPLFYGTDKAGDERHLPLILKGLGAFV